MELYKLRPWMSPDFHVNATQAIAGYSQDSTGRHRLHRIMSQWRFMIAFHMCNFATK